MVTIADHFHQISIGNLLPLKGFDVTDLLNWKVICLERLCRVLNYLSILKYANQSLSNFHRIPQIPPLPKILFHLFGQLMMYFSKSFEKRSGFCFDLAGKCYLACLVILKGGQLQFLVTREGCRHCYGLLASRSQSEFDDFLGFADLRCSQAEEYAEQYKDPPIHLSYYYTQLIKNENKDGS